MCSKHVEACNKLIVKQKFCASIWLITEINTLGCTVSKTSKITINMINIFTSTQNKGGFVVLLLGVVKGNTFAKITFSLFGVLTFPLIKRNRREICQLQCRSEASS